MRKRGPMPGSPPDRKDASGHLNTPRALTQHAAESLPAHNFTSGAVRFLTRLNQSVVQPLMVSLLVIMSQESNYGGLQPSLPEKDHPMEALVLHGTHETLDVRRQIGRAR